MTGWDNFFVAVCGSAAALTGLIFVGVSFSLTKILAIPQLPDRAGQALILLVNVLVCSSICLMPCPLKYIGVALILVGAIAWILSFKLDRQMLGKTEAQYKKMAWGNFAFTQLATLPYIISGIAIICMGAGGIYLLIPGILFSFIKSVLDAWVLVLEIHR